MRNVDPEKSQRQVDELLKLRKLKAKTRADCYSDLLPHATEILAWANATGISKSVLKDLCKIHLKLKVSKDRLYRFVKKLNDGNWPNGRN